MAAIVGVTNAVFTHTVAAALLALGTLAVWAFVAWIERGVTGFMSDIASHRISLDELSDRLDELNKAHTETAHRLNQQINRGGR